MTTLNGAEVIKSLGDKSMKCRYITAAKIVYRDGTIKYFPAKSFRLDENWLLVNVDDRITLRWNKKEMIKLYSVDIVRILKKI